MSADIALVNCPPEILTVYVFLIVNVASVRSTSEIKNLGIKVYRLFSVESSNGVSTTSKLPN